MTLPNFTIAGAAKCGTSALTQMLAQHPDVFLSTTVEPHYFLFPSGQPSFTGPGDSTFNESVVASWEQYVRLFDGSNGHRAVGEASVAYLYQPSCFKLMMESLPGVGVVLLLRNPVDRAFSAYSHMKLDGREPASSFGEALKREGERIAAGWEYIWHYREMGRYASQVRQMLEHVPRERVLMLRTDDLRRDPAGVLARTFSFIGVDPHFTPDVGLRANVSGQPRSAALHRLVSQPTQAKSLVKKALPEDVRRRIVRRVRNANLRRISPEPEAVSELAEFYHSDILELQEVTGWDLSAWLHR